MSEKSLLRKSAKLTLDITHVIGWGTGNYFREIVVPEERHDLEFLVDGDQRRWGQSVAGLAVCSPEKLKELDPAETLVVVFSTSYDEIAPRILAYGHRHVCPGKEWIELQLDVADRALQQELSEDCLGRLHYRRAELLKTAERHWQVIGALEQAVAAHQKCGDWHWALGRAYERMQKFREAAGSYKRAIRLVPNPSPDWYYRLGLMYENAGEASRAQEAFDKAVDLQGEIAREIGVAFFHHRAGEYTREIEALQNQIASQANPFLYFRLAKAFERSFLWREAIAAYRRALDPHDSSAYWWYRLGCVYERGKEWAAAVDAYEKALERCSSSPASWLYRLGISLYFQGKYEEACAAFLKTLPGGNCIELSNIDSGFLEIQQQLRENILLPDSWYALGDVYEHQGEWVKAVDAYQEAVSRDDKQLPGVYGRLAYALLQMGKHEEACRAFMAIRPSIKMPFVQYKGVPSVAACYAEHVETLLIEKNVILCDSVSCSLSDSLCQMLLRNRAFANWRFIWAVGAGFEAPENLKTIPNVVVVRRGSPLYARYLATAKYLVSDLAFPTYFSRRKGQRYLHMWNDTEFEKLEEDIDGGNVFGYKNVIRNLLHVTHLVCPSQRVGSDRIKSVGLIDSFPGKFLVGDNESVLPEFLLFDDSEDYSRKGKRKSVLLGCPPFSANGITTSLLNLLKALPESEFHVVLLVDPNAVSLDADRMQKFQELPGHVEVVFKTGAVNASYEERWLYARLHARYSLDSATQWAVYGKMYEIEFVRLFGAARFDVLVDYWGYSLVLASLLAFAPKCCGQRSIYMHNTMHREKEAKFPKLQAVFQLYQRFDHIIAVSLAGLEKQKQVIGRNYAVPQGKFAFCRYAVDPCSVRERADEEPREFSLKDWNGDGVKRFVVAGRFSPEKGHEKLLRAFAQIHARFPRTELWCLGDGPLFLDMQNLIQELALTDVVRLPGFVTNPFPYIKACDSLVLPSDHEGQPLTLLEAMILGVPIVATEIDGVKELLEEHRYGLLVDNSIEGLVAGMTAFLEGRVNQPCFDVDAYQQKAIAEFCSRVLDASAR